MRYPPNLPEPLRRALWNHGPSVARRIVHVSSLAARLKLATKAPLRVLIDNTVLFHGVTHETAWVSTGRTKWGHHEVDTGYSARIPVRAPDKNSREYRNIRYLPGIAHLAKAGRLHLMTSGELSVEQDYQPIGRFRGYGYFDLNIFRDVEIPLVDNRPDHVYGPSWLGLPSTEEARDRRLAESTDPLFRALASQLGQNNSQDAWHIRTAETNGMFCFLTMDFKLLKSLNSRAKLEPIRSLKTKILTPEQFGKYLWLAPINPALLSYEDASWPVRPDLHWPDSKRRRPKKTPSDNT